MKNDTRGKFHIMRNLDDPIKTCEDFPTSVDITMDLDDPLKKSPEEEGNPDEVPFSTKMLPQILASLAAFCGAFTLGTSWFWTATGLPKIIESGDFGEISKSDKSWMLSSAAIGGLAVNPILGWCINAIGRRNTLMYSCVPMIACWVITIFAKNLETIMAARVIIGGISSLNGQVSPLLIAETVQPQYRGFLMTMFEFFITIATLLLYVAGSLLSWELQSLICLLVPLVQLIALSLIPESPYFLMEKNRKECAGKSLAWLRGAKSPSAVKTELAEVEHTVYELQSEGGLNWKEIITDPSVWKPVLLGLALMSFFQLTYINVVLSTTVEIFQSAGTLDEYFSTILIGVLQVVATFVPIFLSDRIGRRILILISLIAVSTSLIVLGTFFKFKELDPNFAKTHSWMPLAALLGYITACSSGIVPLSWVVSAEICPPKAKGLGTGIVGIGSRVIGLTLMFTFWDLYDILQPYGTYWFIAALNIVAFIVLYIYLPETKGKSLEEIQASFMEPKKPSSFDL